MCKLLTELYIQVFFNLKTAHILITSKLTKDYDRMKHNIKYDLVIFYLILLLKKYCKVGLRAINLRDKIIYRAFIANSALSCTLGSNVTKSHAVSWMQPFIYDVS